LVLVLPALPVRPITGPSKRARAARARVHKPSISVSLTINCGTLTPSIRCGTIIATAPAACALSAKSQPSRALAKLEMKPPLGVPLNATNRQPGFTRRLSCVTKSIGVSGYSPARPSARATSAMVHNGVVLMPPSLQARRPPPRDH
jgi:hypothetical protein